MDVAILQRVASASVTVDKQLISSIGKGVLVFAAVAPNDTTKEVESMASKVVKMKLWQDASGANVGSKEKTSECFADQLRSGSKALWTLMERYSVVRFRFPLSKREISDW